MEDHHVVLLRVHENVTGFLRESERGVGGETVADEEGRGKEKGSQCDTGGREQEKKLE